MANNEKGISMTGQDLISIIVPVYNVAPYLACCMDSICRQTYGRLEIILVDDGSTDGSGEICDSYGAMDSRIRVIHQTNGGLSAARNAGIEQAAGELLCFVDSDDYLDPDALSRLYQTMQENQADLAVAFFQYVAEDADGTVPIEPCRKGDTVVVEGREALSYIYRPGYQGVAVVAWGKLYRRELWENIRFPEGKCHEDEFVCHYILHEAKRVVFLRESLYYYRLRGQSITGRRFHLKRLDAQQAFRDRICFLQQLGYDDLANQAKEVYLWWLVKAYCSVRRYEKTEKEVQKNLWAEFARCYRETHVHRLRKRIYYRVFYLCPAILSWAAPVFHFYL